MVKKRKVMLMTKLAMYEKLEEKYMSKAKKYFRGDYISWNMIKTIIAITIVYFIGVGVWFIYNSEFIMQNLSSLNYYAIIRYAIVLYVVLLLSYGVLAYVLYSVRYQRALKCMRKYEKGLKQLAKICVEERNNSGSDKSEETELTDAEMEWYQR